jgi:hypothetical protein
MTPVTARNKYGHSIDFIFWSPTLLHTSNRAARKIADRSRITIPHAIAIARIAGVSVELEVRR